MATKTKKELSAEAEEPKKKAPVKRKKKDPDAVPRPDIAANNIEELVSKASQSEAKEVKAKPVEETVEYIDGESYAGPRYSDEDLEIFRQNILKAKKEATEELRMLKERLDDYQSGDNAGDSNIYSMHMAEQGPEALEQEKTFAQVHRNSEYIKKLDDALARIKDKTYGICRKCKCLIAKERLLAVPVTTLSASYKIHSRCPEDGIDRIEPIKK